MTGQDGVPIGRGLGNTRTYLLDAQLRPVAAGVAGELYIAGVQVARGYLNRPEQTAQSFLADPFVSGERMYKTGDICRLLPDGNITYVGRNDEQVKVRGYRIELGEIENVLEQSSHVSQGVVLARTDDQGNKRLVGYVVPANAELFDKEELITFLKTRLPEYMVPGWWVVLDKLPLTGNGKIDKKALPDPDANDLITQEYVAPANQLEQTLAVIWQELLGLTQVGVHDNFFELGGDSIITIQVVSRARRAGYGLNPRDLFTCQTISRLAAFMDLQQEVKVVAEQGTLTGNSGLLPIQQWLLHTETNALSHYNQHIVLTVAKNIGAEQLQIALDKLVNHHDALRFAYHLSAGQWEQTYSKKKKKIRLFDYTQKANEWPEAIQTNLDLLQVQVALAQGNLLQAALLIAPADAPANQLLLVVHHLAVDGVSWRILTDDLELLLQQEEQPVLAVLGNKTSSVRQWYNTMTAYGKRTNLLNEEAYWRKTKQGLVPLRTDHLFNEAITIADIQSHTVKLERSATSSLLKDVPKAYHTEINDILLNALALTIASHNNNNKVLVGMEGHGREDLAADADTSRTVGWLTSMFPVLLEVETGAGKGQQLKNIKEQLRQVPGKGIGYGLLKYINKTESLQGKDSWEVLFNYLGQSGHATTEGLYTVPQWELFGSSAGSDFPVEGKLAINSMIIDDELVLYWSYSNRHFDAETIHKLAADYLSHLEDIIKHCVARGTASFTPSDYGLGDVINYNELDQFLDDDYNGKQRKLQLESISRLSGLQEGMLFHSLYDQQGGAYIQQFTGELRDADMLAFIDSWQQLLKQHSILRSAFYYDVFQIPVQCVYKEARIPVTQLDLQTLSAEQQILAIQEYKKEDLLKGFDFVSAPLMRICLIQLDETRYQFCLTHHHILLDGWSMPVLMEELLTNYEYLVSKKAIPVVTEDRYENYIRYIERQDKEAAVSYWRNYLDGLEEATLLPFINNLSDRTKGNGGYSEEIFQLDAEFTARLTRYAQQNRVTINTLMQGIWSYLLYNYTGRKDVSFGIVVSGRPEDLPGVESAIGMYINTLPLHGQIDLSQDIAAGLQKIQEEQLESRAYQYTGLSEIQRLSGITGNLFDTLMVFENYPVSQALESQPWSLQINNLDVGEQHTNYPLSIIVMAGKEIAIHFSYNDLLDENYVKLIAGHFKHVLDQVVSAGKQNFGEINLLTSAEQEQLLIDFNATSISPLPAQTVVTRFAEQAALQLDHPAIIAGENSLSYRELDEQSSRFAHYLGEKGVKKGTLVPVCQERSAGIVISVLAIAKAGGVYVPIDPGYPAERIQYMLADTGASLLIANEKVLAGLPVIPDLELINPEELKLDTYPATAPVIPVGLEDLVYVIYTLDLQVSLKVYDYPCRAF